MSPFQWRGSQFGPVIGWLYSQDLSHLYPQHILQAGLINRRSKVWRLGWCPRPSTGRFACLQKMTGSDSIPPSLGVFVKVMDSWEFPLHQNALECLRIGLCHCFHLLCPKLGAVSDESVTLKFWSFYSASFCVQTSQFRLKLVFLKIPCQTQQGEISICLRSASFQPLPQDAPAQQALGLSSMLTRVTVLPNVSVQQSRNFQLARSVSSLSTTKLLSWCQLLQTFFFFFKTIMTDSIYFKTLSSVLVRLILPIAKIKYLYVLVP